MAKGTVLNEMREEWKIVTGRNEGRMERKEITRGIEESIHKN
jgi:hypothetical protein